MLDQLEAWLDNSVRLFKVRELSCLELVLALLQGSCRLDFLQGHRRRHRCILDWECMAAQLRSHRKCRLHSAEEWLAMPALRMFAGFVQQCSKELWRRCS